MGLEETNITAVKTSSDGTVKIAIETYNELVSKAAEKPPVINKTTVIKTAEMLAQEHRVSGITFMGLGVSMLAVGAFRFKAGRPQPS